LLTNAQTRLLLWTGSWVLAQPLPPPRIDCRTRPLILGEKPVQAALVVDLDHEQSIDPLNGLVVRHEQTAQVTLKMLELLRAKQVLVVLGILVNKWRDLDQGYHVTSHRFRGGNPLGSPYIPLGLKSKFTAKVESCETAFWKIILDPKALSSVSFWDW